MKLNIDLEQIEKALEQVGTKLSVSEEQLTGFSGRDKLSDLRASFTEKIQQLFNQKAELFKGLARLAAILKLDCFQTSKNQYRVSLESGILRIYQKDRRFGRGKESSDFIRSLSPDEYSRLCEQMVFGIESEVNRVKSVLTQAGESLEEMRKIKERLIQVANSL